MSSSAAVPGIRASDEEREALVVQLREHAATGRLTLEEFSTRMERAYAARTRDELDRLTADLPAVQAGTGTVARRRPTRWSIAVMGGIERRGRWRLGERTAAVSIMGGTVLDLREVEIDGPEVTITAVTVMGGIEVIVPEGIDVELRGFVLMGGKSMRLSDAPRVPGTPLVRIRAFGLMGGVDVRTRPSH